MSTTPTASMPSVTDSSPATEPVVRVSGLRKTYGDKVAVQDVSFEVRPGEILGVLGQNGAGKTTTVEAVAGLRTAAAGTVSVLGLDPQRDPAPVREVLGVQLQESRLPGKLRVEEALRLYASFYADPRDPDELITLLGLQEKRHTAYDKLSGGQKQRLSIALALVGNPRVAILDELTTGLDPQARRETWDLIEAVRDSGVTILLVTHFMDEAERLCDRVIIIDQGRIVAEGTPAELARQGRTGVTFQVSLGDALEDVEVLRRLPSVTSVTSTDATTTITPAQRRTDSGTLLEITGGPTVLPDVIIALHSQGIVPDEVQTISPSLEDAFVALVGHPSEEDPT
ncbi:ABC transporter ATP-binding protein [Ornithinimicrobium sp. F0845]|uniref:ABC transporter ATP-binding protein n=1 Tax=Ornithinimicrobium sp. F0845 TaxID=2926412 RepID=UPI001FF37060|nr:ABC transporter ATP-binding protein [Ornithinimicrobium sp. F0845]MCK0111198.1 ABC transporter ATP-binding protein [Ornithinimicrobium sp. F0845]